MTNREKVREKIAKKLAEQTLADEFSSSTAVWKWVVDNSFEQEYFDKANQILAIPGLAVLESQDAKTVRLVNEEWAVKSELQRQGILREVAQALEEEGLIGEFGICLNLDKWDKFIQALKEGRLP